ncbi:MAG: class I SAM-dependent methyltransferase [Candidatus Atabeyarchaeum deiterrae]
MRSFPKLIIKKIFSTIGLDIARKSRKTTLSPTEIFLSFNFQRTDQRRLEHLESLGLNVHGSSVLELGAGIGGLTSFFIDRDCEVVTSDARKENLEVLRSRYPGVRVLSLDLDSPPRKLGELFDIIHCYGLLYHLRDPEGAIEFMSHCCRKMLLLETCVSFGDDDSILSVAEDALWPAASVSGVGCRPTRRWVYNRLKKHFGFVYLPTTQPNYKDFILDWTSPPPDTSYIRSIFVASRHRITSKFLKESIPMKQTRH